MSGFINIMLYGIFIIVNFAEAAYYHIKYESKQTIEHKEIVSMLKCILWALMILVCFVLFNYDNIPIK